MESKTFMEISSSLKFGRLEEVQSWIERGGDITLRDIVGQTAFFYVIDNPLRQYKMVDYLIKKGVDIKAKNSNGVTPLFCAVARNYVDIIQLLIEHGADINGINGNDRGGGYSTVLSYASKWGYSEAVHCLVANGADITIKDNKGETPFFSAIRRGHIKIAKFLIQSGADITIRNKEGDTPFRVVFLHTIYDKEKNKASQRAIAECLLKAGANICDVSEGDLKKLFPKMDAFRHALEEMDYSGILQYLGGKDSIASFTIKKGTPLSLFLQNLLDKKEKTSCTKQEKEIIKGMIYRGADRGRCYEMVRGTYLFEEVRCEHEADFQRFVLNEESLAVFNKMCKNDFQLNSPYFVCYDYDHHDVQHKIDRCSLYLALIEVFKELLNKIKSIGAFSPDYLKEITDLLKGLEAMQAEKGSVVDDEPYCLTLKEGEVALKAAKNIQRFLLKSIRKEAPFASTFPKQPLHYDGLIFEALTIKNNFKTYDPTKTTEPHKEEFERFLLNSTTLTLFKRLSKGYYQLEDTNRNDDYFSCYNLQGVEYEVNKGMLYLVLIKMFEKLLEGVETMNAFSPACLEEIKSLLRGLKKTEVDRGGVVNYEPGNLTSEEKNIIFTAMKKACLAQTGKHVHHPHCNDLVFDNSILDALPDEMAREVKEKTDAKKRPPAADLPHPPPKRGKTTEEHVIKRPRASGLLSQFFNPPLPKRKKSKRSTIGKIWRNQ